MKKNKQVLTLEQIVRKLGHMLAIREQAGDQSKDYKEKRAMHDNLLYKLYSGRS